MKQGHRMIAAGVRTTGQALSLVALCGLLAACGQAPGDGGPVAQPSAAPSAVTHATSATASFQATIGGDVALALEGESASAGAMYGRYHLSFAGRPAGDSGPVIISLARGDTASPGPGTYTLGDGGDFDGNIEIHPGPADYAIDSGELVITAAVGDALVGRFAFSASERVGAGAITVDGSFQTRSAD